MTFTLVCSLKHLYEEAPSSALPSFWGPTWIKTPNHPTRVWDQVMWPPRAPSITFIQKKWNHVKLYIYINKFLYSRCFIKEINNHNTEHNWCEQRLKLPDSANRVLCHYFLLSVQCPPGGGGGTPPPLQQTALKRSISSSSAERKKPLMVALPASPHHYHLPIWLGSVTGDDLKREFLPETPPTACRWTVVLLNRAWQPRAFHFIQEQSHPD